MRKLEFTCDTCNKPINLEDGWVEWLEKDGIRKEFRICHNKNSCKKHAKNNSEWLTMDSDLIYFFNSIRSTFKESICYQLKNGPDIKITKMNA